MKKIVYLLIASFISTITLAQQKAAMPDISKMMKMNPQELEAYKQQLLKKSSQQAKGLRVWTPVTLWVLIPVLIPL